MLCLFIILGEMRPASKQHWNVVLSVADVQQPGLRALKDLNLLEQVVEHKQHFFREGGARYEVAKKGTLRLAPGP
jgi:hypothetical protein